MKNKDNALSVFLVDDDRMFLTALKQKLTDKFKATIKISTFPNGEECVSRMEDKPDIVVLDYYLDSPDGNHMNGMEVLQKIKTVSGKTEVVMLSGEGREEVKENSLRLGAYKYLQKNATSAHTLQNTIKDIIHEIIVNRSAKENKQVNFIMGGVLVVLTGLIIYLYMKYF
jgi:DNA-binding NarL/FixJ family response regulator